MPIESIQCVKCGSPLEVESTAKAVTCGYCGSRLRITPGASGHPLGVLEDIKVDTEILAKQTAINHLEVQLERLQHCLGEREEPRALLWFEREELREELQAELDKSRPPSWVPSSDRGARYETVVCALLIAFCGISGVGLLAINDSSQACGGVFLLLLAAMAGGRLARSRYLRRKYERSEREFRERSERAEREFRERYGPDPVQLYEQIESTERRITELRADMDRLAREL